jgi:hypothetical protein
MKTMIGQSVRADRKSLACIPLSSGTKMAFCP